MIKKIFIPVIIAVNFILPACKIKPAKKLMPEIAACDSAAIMYYQTPGNPRFFNMVKVYDKASISAFSEEVNEVPVTGKDSCITQGKIYFYGKGDAVYVVYFSRAEECMTLSFIKTGEKYFTAMSKDIKRLLDEWQKNAKEPVAGN